MIIQKTYNSFLIFGNNFNTSQKEEDIENFIQSKLDDEFDISVEFHYYKINNEEIVFVFYRNTEYLLDGRDWLTDSDMRLLSGLTTESLRKRYCKCLIPFGEDYYIPVSECGKIYDRLMQDRGNEHEKVQIWLDDEKLVTKIIF